MDSAKLGRALGYGTRHALKTLAKVADAATTPSPTAARPAERRATPGEALQQSVRTVAAVHEEARKAKRSMFAPLRTFSSVLWLQVTGVFFAIFALSLGTATWKTRAAVHSAASSPEAQKFYLYAGLFAIFVYFTISSFVRARKRERTVR